MTYEEQATVFKALSDPRRLAVLELLQAGERCACVLLAHLDMAQSSLSYHMKILCQSGLVLARQEGKWTHYSLSPTGRKRALGLLAALTALPTNQQADPAFCVRTCASEEAAENRTGALTRTAGD